MVYNPGCMTTRCVHVCAGLRMPCGADNAQHFVTALVVPCTRGMGRGKASGDVKSDMGGTLSHGSGQLLACCVLLAAPVPASVPFLRM